MIKECEIGAKMIAKSDRGYNVLVGSTPEKMSLFTSYKDHPRKLVMFEGEHGTIKSTAAGAYQILSRYYDAYKKTLKLQDFSPESQDRIALQMIREQKAYNDVLEGRFLVAVAKCRNIWASLPGAGYGQPEKSVTYVQNMYIKHGGIIA